jgi:methylated-DNA-[protein]-cysteine S-methyltransferase
MGTPFQQGVWRQLRAIPYGKTLSYGHVARLLGRPGAARAVGGACHANPLLILIPCHRVVGSTGALTGFGAGLAVKKALLELEGWPGSPGDHPIVSAQ